MASNRRRDGCAVSLNQKELNDENINTFAVGFRWIFAVAEGNQGEFLRPALWPSAGAGASETGSACSSTDGPYYISGDPNGKGYLRVSLYEEGAPLGENLGTDRGQINSWR